MVAERNGSAPATYRRIWQPDALGWPECRLELADNGTLWLVDGRYRRTRALLEGVVRCHPVSAPLGPAVWVEGAAAQLMVLTDWVRRPWQGAGRGNLWSDCGPLVVLRVGRRVRGWRRGRFVFDVADRFPPDAVPLFGWLPGRGGEAWGLMRVGQETWVTALGSSGVHVQREPLPPLAAGFVWPERESLTVIAADARSVWAERRHYAGWPTVRVAERRVWEARRPGWPVAAMTGDGLAVVWAEPGAVAEADWERGTVKRRPTAGPVVLLSRGTPGGPVVVITEEPEREPKPMAPRTVVRRFSGRRRLRRNRLTARLDRLEQRLGALEASARPPAASHRCRLGRRG
jgi:hypothetical protein